MAYRADRAAIEHQLASLKSEVVALASAQLEAIELEARMIALETEIARTEAALRDERPRLPILERLAVAGPCDQPWSQMKGTASIRRCEVCDQRVFNLEAMSRQEIEDMVLFTNGTPCVRLKRRRDGTIITRECVRAEADQRLRRARTQLARDAAIVAMTAIIAGGAAYAWRYAQTHRTVVHAEASMGVSSL